MMKKTKKPRPRSSTTTTTTTPTTPTTTTTSTSSAVASRHDHDTYSLSNSIDDDHHDDHDDDDDSTSSIPLEDDEYPGGVTRIYPNGCSTTAASHEEMDHLTVTLGGPPDDDDNEEELFHQYPPPPPPDHTTTFATSLEENGDHDGGDPNLSTTNPTTTILMNHHGGIMSFSAQMVPDETTYEETLQRRIQDQRIRQTIPITATVLSTTIKDEEEDGEDGDDDDDDDDDEINYEPSTATSSSSSFSSIISWKLICFIALIGIIGLGTGRLVLLNREMKSNNGTTTTTSDNNNNDNPSMGGNGNGNNNDNNNNGEGDDSSVIATLPNLEILRDIISEVSGDGAIREVLLDPTSPRYQAIQWLAREDTALLRPPLSSTSSSGPPPPRTEDDEEATSVTIKNTLMERYAIVLFYFATGGPTQWSNSLGFLSNSHICDWGGSTTIVCGGPQMDTVEILRIFDNNLVGTLPKELGALTSLKELQFVKNPNLVGTIHESWGKQLSQLQILHITQSSVGGIIPSSIGRLLKLKELYLSENELTGSIPFELLGRLSIVIPQQDNNQDDEDNGGEQQQQQDQQTLPWVEESSLEWINLSANYLTGTIPEVSESLVHIRLDDNVLEGTIPSSIYQLSNVWCLSVYNNHLSGTIATELGQLSNLEWLLLNSNNFIGTIPTQLGLLRDLEIFYLQMNQLSGTIPTQLSTLTRLDRFMVFRNNLSSSIPSEIGLISSLRVFLLGMNPQLTGTLPMSFVNNAAAAIENTGTVTSSSLEWLDLSFTNITGGGPIDAICNQADLRTEIWADCNGNPPRVDCECCTICCNPETVSCTANLTATCQIYSARFTSDGGAHYDESRETSCDCSTTSTSHEDGQNGTMTEVITEGILSCQDTSCPSCNRDNTVCALSTDYGVQLAPTGVAQGWKSTFQYVEGRDDRVTFEYSYIDFSCRVTVNDEECHSCFPRVCADGFVNYAVKCDNVEGVGNVDLCNGVFEGGALTVFELVDLRFLSGCPPRFDPYLPLEE